MPVGRQARQTPEANEVILINSHDGASSYQMMAGMLRFVCCNGLVVGDVTHDIRIPHKGDIHGEVIDGAFRVLDSFDSIGEAVDAMKLLTLRPYEETAFATAALALRFGERAVDEARPPSDARHGPATDRGQATRGHRPQLVGCVPAGPVMVGSPLLDLCALRVYVERRSAAPEPFDRADLNAPHY